MNNLDTFTKDYDVSVSSRVRIFSLSSEVSADSNEKSIISNNGYVLYFMHTAQRFEYNFSLFHAISAANKLGIPVVIAFLIDEMQYFGEKIHFDFEMQGLIELSKIIKQKKIPFYVIQNSDKKIESISKHAALVVTDEPYLRQDKLWLKQLASTHFTCCLIHTVDSNSCVPYFVASQKEEYNAAFLRRKINRVIDDYVVPLEIPAMNIMFDLNTEEPFAAFEKETGDNLNSSLYPGGFSLFRSGVSEARRKIIQFVGEKIENYETLRNEPSERWFSDISPYLRAGQISPIEIALHVIENKPDYAGKFLDEVIARRDLSINFVNYNPIYDKFECLPDWAIKTLNEHRIYDREYIYSRKEFENAATHDIYWNAAQTEMIKTGKMHGYMRMYWGKKVLEWSRSPEDAFYIALEINNKYNLDGWDSNSFAGVAWCFGKHDRPWFEREIFGKVRYMNSNGLKRKFNIEKYVEMF